jgi:hypothetical protein
MGLNEVFKKVSAINEVTELASHQVELATTYNDATEQFQFNLKMYNESLARVKDLQAKLSRDVNMVKKNNEDLLRIKKSLNDLGFASDAANLDKLLSQNLLSKFDKLINSIKSF